MFFKRKSISVILILMMANFSNAQEATLSVISNTKGAPSNMKMTELKSVLKGEKQRWSNGSKVTIYLMKPTTPIGLSTCSKVYNMNPDNLKRFWLQLSFSGRADAPTYCNTAEELELLVSQNPGSIGIIDKSSTVTATKTVLIEGRNSF